MRNAGYSAFVGSFPATARLFLSRRIAELAGVGLIATVILTGLALATWSTRDPSLNHATAGPIRNLLGLRGAVVADLLTQIFGIASIALLAPIALLGWRLVVDHGFDRPKSRIALWLLGVLSAAAVASMLPPPGRWPLPTGLGGMIGDATAGLARWATGGARIGIASGAATSCPPTLGQCYAGNCSPGNSLEQSMPPHAFVLIALPPDATNTTLVLSAR